MGNLVHLLISQYIQIISFNICCNIRALRREPTFFSGVWYSATEVVLKALFPPEMDSEVSIWVQAVYLGHDPRAHTSRGIENWDNWRKSIKAFIIKAGQHFGLLSTILLWSSGSKQTICTAVVQGNWCTFISHGHPAPVNHPLKAVPTRQSQCPPYTCR